MARPKSRYSAIFPADQFVGTKDAAGILGVSVSTIHKMLATGALAAWRTSGGHRRIPLTQLREAAERLNVPLTDALMARAAAAAEVSQAGTAVPDALQAPVTAQGGGPLRVLLVDDNLLALKALEAAIAVFGARVRVTVTQDAAEALSTMADEPPDLVVTELVMRPNDGFHLLREMKKSDRLRRIAVLVVTAQPDECLQQLGDLAPRIPVYRKPVSRERLGGLIDGLMLCLR